MQKIAVGRMQLDGVEAQPDGALCRLNKVGLDACQLVACQRKRQRLFGPLRNRRWRQGLPPTVFNGNKLTAIPGRGTGGLASGVRQLDSQFNGRRGSYHAYDASQRSEEHTS